VPYLLFEYPSCHPKTAPKSYNVPTKNDAIVYHLYTKFEIRIFPKIQLIFCLSINQPGDLDLLTSKWGHRYPVSWASLLTIFSISMWSICYALPFLTYGQA